MPTYHQPTYERDDDIVGYTYQAENLCPHCLGAAFGVRPAATIEFALDVLAGNYGIVRSDETTFDSDGFPKIIVRGSVEAEEQCGQCGDLLENRYSSYYSATPDCRPPIITNPPRLET